MGEESYEVLMFTHDPAFDPNGPRWEEVIRWCDANGIRRDQIFNIKSSTKYCKECSEQVIAFQQRFRDKLRGARILHDDGGAFKNRKQLIVEEYAERVEVLPPDQHGELSVLDNKLNAVAKKLWRQERHHEDHAWNSFLLLVKLQSVGEDPIKSWWRQNYMLDMLELKLDLVEERLKSRGGDVVARQDLADKYEASYANWREDNEEVEPIYEPDMPAGGLDGAYWR
jgi:hypothetical protein